MWYHSYSTSGESVLYNQGCRPVEQLPLSLSGAHHNEADAQAETKHEKQQKTLENDGPVAQLQCGGGSWVEASV